MGKNPAKKLATKANTESAAKPAKKAVAKKKVSAKKVSTKSVDSTAAKSCAVKGCKREYRAKSYCKSHYRQWRHGKFGKKRFKACKENECLIPMGLNRHGYCETHYQNYYIKGIVAPKVVETKEEDNKEVAAAG